MKKHPLATEHMISFRCSAAERLAIGMAMAQTGMSLSEVARQCVRACLQPQLDLVQAAAAECPEGEIPDRWLFKCAGKLMATAEAARLRAKADELDAKAR